ncbi:hypothetical protein D3C71_1641870 [compost metagenome]
MGNNEGKDNEQHGANAGFQKHTGKRLPLRLGLARKVGDEGNDPHDEQECQGTHQTKRALPADGAAQQRPERYTEHQSDGRAGTGYRNCPTTEMRRRHTHRIAGQQRPDDAAENAGEKACHQ